MNKYITALLLSILLNLTVQSQNCITKKVNTFFVEIDIRGSSINPIIMTGLTSTVNISQYAKDSPMLFLQSFYSLGEYVPDVNSIRERLPLECQNKGYNAKSMMILSNKLFKKSIKKQLLLKTGENVFLRISKIQAEFLVLDKNDKVIPINSNEIALSEFEKIKQGYIPLIIYYCKKPKRKEIQ